MNADDALNPDLDSLEACLLILAAFQLCTDFIYSEDAESSDKSIEAVKLLGLRRLKTAWSKITGYSVETDNTVELDFNNYMGILNVLIEEFKATEEPLTLIQQFCYYIEDENLKLMLLAFVWTLASVDGVISDTEDALLDTLQLEWNIVLGPNWSESKLQTAAADYGFSDINTPSMVELSKLKHSSGKDVDDTSCFIATAVLGVNHSSLVPLRWYRDNVLLNYSIGKMFVSWYYKKGPVMAMFIKDKPALKQVIKSLFVLPLSSLIRFFK